MRSSSFEKMIAYAKFSSDNPSLYLLAVLRDRIKDESKLARLLQQVWKSNDDVQGVLCALYQSWTGKPFIAGVNSDEFKALDAAYEYLKNLRQSATLANKNPDEVCSLILNHFYTLSNDVVMWYNFLSKTQTDNSFDVNLNAVLMYLVEKWLHQRS
ncbi:hypothetical protein Plhal703r1_c30g0118971 [Plasmopara halstedii]